MDSVRFERWNLDINIAATRRAYKGLTAGGADICACDGCRNFALQRERIFPDALRNFFDRSGIDYRREIEVAHICKLANGKHSYLGWFYCVGTIVSSVSANNSAILYNRAQYVRIDEDFIIALQPHASCKVGAFKDMSVIEIDFYVDIPWTLDVLEPLDLRTK
jgi:hypothetical protein